MVIDGHIHAEGRGYRGSELLEDMSVAGVAGGVVLSAPPASYTGNPGPDDPGERLSAVVACTSPHDELYPFFWIDPTDAGARKQVASAASAGVSGFKIICNSFPPGDPKAMDTYHAIAEAGKPILFHSGILWDNSSSSRFNRPAEFEALIGIPSLRFALAHVGWPWCDEAIAVYGKFLAAYTSRPGEVPEMFIDTTPGTPVIYRQSVLEKIYTIGYDVAHNVIFGTDCTAPGYNTSWAREWIERDTHILKELGVDESGRKRYFGKNLKRFLGIAEPGEGTRERRPLRQGE